MLGVLLSYLLGGHFVRLFAVRVRTILNTTNIAFMCEELQKSSFHRCWIFHRFEISSGGDFGSEMEAQFPL